MEKEKPRAKCEDVQNDSSWRNLREEKSRKMVVGRERAGARKRIEVSRI